MDGKRQAVKVYKTYQAKSQEIHMWLSRIKIDDYFVVHFNHISAFKASAEGVAHTCFIALSDIHVLTRCVRASITLSGSSVIHCLELNDVLNYMQWKNTLFLSGTATHTIQLCYTYINTTSCRTYVHVLH